LKRSRPALSVISYGDDDNRSLGNTMVGELRSRGYAVTVFKLWPASGPASYDSAASVIARGSVVLFPVVDRPVPWRGTVGLPDAMMKLIDSTALSRPTVVVSLGNPYLISSLPGVGSYLIGWRANAVTEQAVARALAGETAITGTLPISIPPTYSRGWGVQRRVR
jgi:hypothetical protein